jgi:hypothetical protein
VPLSVDQSARTNRAASVAALGKVAAPGTCVVRLEVANIPIYTILWMAATAWMRTGPMRPASDRLAAAKEQKGGQKP